MPICGAFHPHTPVNAEHHRALTDTHPGEGTRRGHGAFVTGSNLVTPAPESSHLTGTDPHSVSNMKPRFKIGQRVCIVRASADWDAPVGALGTVASYDGANYRGTDWEIGFLRDGAGVYEPAWPIDESCLVEAGPGASDPLPFEDQCLAVDGSWSDAIITCSGVNDPADRDARLAHAVAALRPLLGGEPLASDCAWYPRTIYQADVLMLRTTWCACQPWIEIIAPLRRRFAESNWIVDDGWSVEMHLDRDAARALLGADVVDFRLFVEPWSSFERRPQGARYRSEPPPPLASLRADLP